MLRNVVSQQFQANSLALWRHALAPSYDVSRSRALLQSLLRSRCENKRLLKRDHLGEGSRFLLSQVVQSPHHRTKLLAPKSLPKLSNHTAAPISATLARFAAIPFPAVRGTPVCPPGHTNRLHCSGLPPCDVSRRAPRRLRWSPLAARIRGRASNPAWRPTTTPSARATTSTAARTR